MMVAVCLPSRGLVHSKTMQCVTEGTQALNKLGVATDVFYSHDLPIPQGHNSCVEQALQKYPTLDKIFFVEEDMYFFPEAFVALATSELPMVTLNYNDKNGRPHGIIEFDDEGEVVWSGLGATAIKREILEKIDKPYFEIKRRWKNIREWKGNKMVKTYEPLQFESEYQYGGLDVDFCMRVRRLGFKITCLKEYKAHHFHLIKLGEPHINNGVHEIRQV